MSDIVVGSGPAGIAAAWARLSMGRRVILLDGGKTLEPENAKLRDTLALGETDVRAQYLDAQRGAMAGQARRYGSDFAMEPAAATFTDAGAIALRSSRAVGGLSNLWGTAVLPFAPKDIADWPVAAEEMSDHIRVVQELMPVAGRHDRLKSYFPEGLSDQPVRVQPTDQGAALVQRLDRHADRLAELGITAGSARLAVSEGCHSCGLCLNGCPWGLMWSAAHSLPKLSRSGKLDHRPGRVVVAITQSGSAVTCHLSDGEIVEGERLFLAAGVLETARILMRSGFASSLTLREARHAFLPGLLVRANRTRPDREPLTTLPQVFMELDDPAVSPFLVHTQLYGWNEQFAPDLARSYGQFLPGSTHMWSMLARRLIVAQVFLHSDHWPGLQIRLAQDGRLTARVTGTENAVSGLEQAVDRMTRGLRIGGLKAFPRASRRAAPGASFHVGASMPMASRPGLMETDRLGRPAASGRMHIVDASVLPTVPATTITLPVMANAHRIASEAPV